METTGLKKSFFNISIVGLGNVINTLMGFLFFTALARTLSLEDFGKYALLITILMFASKLTDFGTNSLYVARAITNPDENKNLLKAFYSIKVLLVGLSLIISLILLKVLNLFQADFMVILVVGLVSYCINFILYALFQKMEKYGILVLLNSVMAIIKLVAAILVFLNLAQLNVTGAFGIFSLSVIPSLFLGAFLPKELRFFGLSFKSMKVFAKDAFPGGVSQMVTESWSTIANSLVKLIKDFSNVGIYSLADKLSAIFSLMAYSIFTVLLPQNAKKKYQERKYDLDETVLISILILILAVVGCLVANTVVIPIFGEKFVSSLPIIYILFFANALLAISSFTENYFFVEGKTKYLLPISAAKVGTFVLLAVILTPMYSLIGIALSQLVAGILTIFIMAGLIVTMEKKSN